MPAPNLGLVGAGGAQALQNEIQKMIAERQAAEQLAYERAIAERDWTAKQQEAEETRAHRKMLQEYQAADLEVKKAAAARQNGPSYQAKDVLLAGKPGYANYNPATGQWTDSDGNILRDIQPIPPRESAGARFQAKDVLVDGRPALAGFDPESNKYFDQAGRELTNVQPIPPRDPVLVIQTMDAQGRPVIQGIPQSQFRGQTLAAQPSGAQQTEMAGLESGLNLIRDLREQFKPSYVGPVEGRLRPTGQQVGITGPPGQAQFYGAAAALKNEIIRLITGAGVGVQETERIMKEIPDITDPDSVYLEKLTQTERNRASLLESIKNRTGISSPAATTPGGAPAGRSAGTSGREGPPSPSTVPPYAGEKRLARDGKTWLGKDKNGQIVELTRLPDGTFTVK